MHTKQFHQISRNDNERNKQGGSQVHSRRSHHGEYEDLHSHEDTIHKVTIANQV
uniref:Beta C3 protein n=1 Tax=Cotton leaf curl Multan betasatellite TaxID=306025 RepID=Q8QNS5_9VIRU|nr:beta C3 protein [Cotton leaf curl Multan betasatellite]